MKRAKKTDHDERTIFDSIRKPTAPPTRKMDPEKPEAKIHPALRKAKHKQKIEME